MSTKKNLPSGSGSSASPDQPENKETRIRRSKLFQAALSGDWNYKVHPDDITATISMNGDTALHIAATAAHSKFAKTLVEMMKIDDLFMKNNVGNTAFCIAAASGNLQLVTAMIEKNGHLAMIPGSADMLPIYMATLFCRKEMAEYLYGIVKDDLTDNNCIDLFLCLISNGLYDVALQLLDDRPKLATARDENEKTALHALVEIPLDKEQGIWKRINPFSGTNRKMPQQALELVKRVWKLVLSSDDDKSSHNIIKAARKLVFVAAEQGNIEFLTTLICEYPDLILAIDENSYSIFHFAVKYRHRDIFKLIHEIGSIKDFIASCEDKKGNNILHLAGMLAPSHRLNIVSGAALQLQQELLWFKEVKKIMNPSDAEAQNDGNPSDAEAKQNNGNPSNAEAMKTDGNSSDAKDKREDGNPSDTKAKQNDGNTSDTKAKQNDGNLSDAKAKKADGNPSDAEPKKDGKTPTDLFSEQHEELKKKGEKWMKGTANYCMIVAALIATVVFTAAFTVPGGIKDDTGTPHFVHKASFKTFVVSDAISLVLSTCSILTFLSILTSRYAEEDFLFRLPNRLVIGLVTLSLSIAALMVVFCATIFIVCKGGVLWVPILVTVIAFLPVIFFTMQQLRLFRDVTRSTYKSSSLFKPSKRTLFYPEENTMETKKEGRRESLTIKIVGQRP